jgi:glycosyltransferase involved in cell wall biosynthesis
MTDRSTLPRVTMVVAMRNESASIERCLASLAGQDHPADRLEVMVYDGGSTDASRSIAEAFVAGRPGWWVKPNPRRIQAAAWNDGIRTATGSYVGIVSGHAELDPSFVSASLRAIEETGADMVGGPVHAIGATTTGEAIAIAMSSPFGVGGARHHYLTERADVDTVFMGFCRRETYLSFPFDETMVRNQDDELSYRLLDAGRRIVCDPAIRSRYWNRASLGRLWRQYFDYGRWKVRVLRAHPGQARLRHFAPLSLVFLLGLGLLASPFLPIARLATGALVLLYLLANAAATLRYGSGQRAAVRLALFAAFPTMHLAFGTGMIEGFVRFVILGAGRSSAPVAALEPQVPGTPDAAQAATPAERDVVAPDAG